jgi:hypothetical protein
MQHHKIKEMVIFLHMVLQCNTRMWQFCMYFICTPFFEAITVTCIKHEGVTCQARTGIFLWHHGYDGLGAQVSHIVLTYSTGYK